MKKLMTLLLFILMSFAMVACSNQNETKEESVSETKSETSNEASKNELKLEDIDQKEYINIDKGGFYVNNKGQVVPKSDIEGYKIVEWYFEPICPHCLALEEETKEYLNEIMGEKTLIKYMPLSFLGRPKNEDLQNRVVTYSDMMTSLINSMVENDPENVTKFMKIVLNEKFIDKLSVLNTVEERSEAIKKVYIEELSGKNWEKIESEMGSYTYTVYNLTRYTGQNDELKSKTPDGTISVPLIYVQGEEKILPINEENIDVRKILEEALK